LLEVLNSVHWYFFVVHAHSRWRFSECLAEPKLSHRLVVEINGIPCVISSRNGSQDYALMPSIFRTGQRLFLFVRNARVPVRVQSHNHNTITLSPGPDLVVKQGVVVPIGCPMPHGYSLYWMQVLTIPNAMGRNAVLCRNPNAGKNLRRRSSRVSVILPVKVKRAGAPHFIESRTANLSMVGVFLESGASIAVGDLMELQIGLPDAPHCSLTAKVCRLAPVMLTDSPAFSTDQPICGAGLSFVNISAEARGLLTQFMWTTIRKLHGSRIPVIHD
jgi:hypothetical protein